MLTDTAFEGKIVSIADFCQWSIIFWQLFIALHQSYHIVPPLLPSAFHLTDHEWPLSHNGKLNSKLQREKIYKKLT